MKIQFSNRAISSFMMAVDHEILEKGEGYTNHTGFFYPVTGTFYGLNVYTTPYRQLVHDTSITGATVVSGLYINGSFIQPGTSGLVSLNIQEGTAYFTGRPTNVSGSFSVKEANVYLTTEPEERLLFETKMWLKSPYPQTLTGLASNEQTYPVVFLKPTDSQNDPFCIGGLNNKKIHIRAIVLAKDQFQCTAICNILEDMAHKKYSLINVTGLPFDAIGGYTGISYSYHDSINGVIDYSYVQSARVSMLMTAQQYNQTNPTIFPAFVDFELWNFINT